jgi:hypothetical protein
MGEEKVWAFFEGVSLAGVGVVIMVELAVIETTVDAVVVVADAFAVIPSTRLCSRST